MGAAHTCLNKVPCPGRVNGCAGAGPKGDAGLCADAEARSPEPAAARERGSGSPTPRHGWSLSFSGEKWGGREPLAPGSLSLGQHGAGLGQPGLVVLVWWGRGPAGVLWGVSATPWLSHVPGMIWPRRRVAQPWCCGRDSSQAGARARREGSDVPGLDPLPGPRGCRTLQPPAAAQMGARGWHGGLLPHAAVGPAVATARTGIAGDAGNMLVLWPVS